MQNCFWCTSIHVENRAHKRADLHVTNNNRYSGRNCTKLILKPLTVKNGLSISVSCIAPFSVDYTISVYMMATLH